MPSSTDTSVQPFDLPDLLGPGAVTAPERRPAPDFRPLIDQVAAPAPTFTVEDVPGGIPSQLLQRERHEARSAGYLDGYRHGSAVAHERANEERVIERQQAAAALAEHELRVTSAVTALQRAAARLEQQAVPGAEQLQSLIVDAAFDIAEHIIGRTLRDDQTRGQDAVRRAIALAPVNEAVTVAVSPADLATLTPDFHRTINGNGTRPITIVADPTLRDGDATATSAATVIDARIADSLARVREVLSQ